MVPSPSARRAWIEIVNVAADPHSDVVALRTEGVDRNYACGEYGSLNEVALRTEGVDRNALSFLLEGTHAGRPPHGGRG